MGLTPTTPDYKALAKSYWATPQGKTGMIVIAASLAALAGFVIYDLDAIIQYANNIAVDTTHLIINALVLAALTSPIWEPDIRRMTVMGFKLFTRALTGIFITIDPIGILRETIQEFKKRLIVLDKGLAGLAGSKRALEADIDSAKEEVSKASSLIDVYGEEIARIQALKTPTQEQMLKLGRLKMGKQGAFEDIGMKKGYIDQEQKLLDMTNDLYFNMSQIRDLAEYNVQHLSDKVDFAEKKRRSITQANNSLAAAMGIMKGDPREVEMFDRTLDYLNVEATNTLGAIDDFNRWAERSLTDKQIQSGVAAREGEKIFAAMKEKLTITEGDGLPTVNAVQDGEGVYTPVERTISATNDYTKYLK